MTIQTLVLLAAALIPAIVLLVYIYRQDKVEHEPLSILLLLLLGGAVSTIYATFLEGLFSGFIDRMPVYTLGSYVIYCVITACMVGLVEESGKLIALRLISWKSRHFDFLFDGVVYAVFVSLGFAALENVLYVFQYGLGNALVRAVTAVPGHMCFSVFMGIYYSRAKLRKTYGDEEGYKRNMRLAFLVPAGIHAFYDSCAMIGGTIPMLIFLVFIIVVYRYAFRLVKAASYYDRPIS